MVPATFLYYRTHMRNRQRLALPRATDRLQLGHTGLLVSPFCIGITGTPDSVVQAFDLGINFFFVSADLHWPLYEHTRQGISKLVAGNRSRRDEIVVAVVSYLDEPLFSALQFHEVVDAVPGLERVDVMVAGAVGNDYGFAKLNGLRDAGAKRHLGSRAVGASFHQRKYALASDLYSLLDLNLVRYNTAHPGARTDLFPYLQPQTSTLMFNLKSMMFRVPEERFRELRLPPGAWMPQSCDYYRFVLSQPALDGILCSPLEPAEVRGMVQAMEQRPLTLQEQEYMIWLSSTAFMPLAHAMAV
jgi:hypothetical protein